VRSTLFRVWKDGGRLASGAFGDARPGVPATRADHFRIGNTGESLIVTLLLQLVDDGRRCRRIERSGLEAGAYPVGSWCAASNRSPEAPEAASASGPAPGA
jgi:hypothetical protein